MGACASSQPVDPQTNYTALEIKVAEMLSKKAKVQAAKVQAADTGEFLTKQPSSTSGTKFSWDRIILKFPAIAANFKRVEHVFNKYDTNNDGRVSMGELGVCMKDLGADLSRGDLVKLFEGVDLDNSRELDKKEFLLCLAIGYVSEYFPATSDVMAAVDNGISLTETFDLVIQAFLTFDASGDGFISRDEVLKIFATTPGTKVTASQRASRSVISQDRWKEMDWNDDGSISFKEFLIAFGSWVGLDDEDDNLNY